MAEKDQKERNRHFEKKINGIRKKKYQKKINKIQNRNFKKKQKSKTIIQMRITF